MKTIQLLWVYHSRLEPDAGIKAHSHEYYHLLCLRNGVLDFTLDESSFQLHAGDLVLVPKGQMHSFCNSTAEPADYYEVKFTLLSQSLTQTLANCECCVRSDAFAFGLVEHIANEYQQSRTKMDDSAAAALTTLVFHLTAESRIISQDEPNVIDTTGYTPLAQKVVSFLLAHFNENLTLDDISAGVGTSKNYLCNAFKRSTGITILDCLNLIRIRKAAELIVYSDLTLTQVAQMCGYVSTSHFNRVFARYVGLPPGQCRRAYSFDLHTNSDSSRRTPDAFMYSVLAGKSISPRTIDIFESDSPSEPD